MQFEWDEAKAAANVVKHGVTFAEAATAFRDALAVVVPDVDHSQAEDREILIGTSEQQRLLFVSFTERAGSIRIISARVATNSERTKYEQHLLKELRHE